MASASAAETATKGKHMNDKRGANRTQAIITFRHVVYLQEDNACTPRMGSQFARCEHFELNHCIA